VAGPFAAPLVLPVSQTLPWRDKFRQLLESTRVEQDCGMFHVKPTAALIEGIV
jgi:hypothetical protein